MQHKDKEQIILRDRKGVVRVAVEEGADGGLVPVYHFGNSLLLSVYYPQAWSKQARKWRMALGFPFGTLGLPLPRKCVRWGGVAMLCGRGGDLPLPLPSLSPPHPAFTLHTWRPPLITLPLPRYLAYRVILLPLAPPPPLLRYPAYMVIGKPLSVTKVAKDHPDFEATVDKLHAQLVSELQDLYNRHRGEYGWGDRPLEIL